MLCLLHYSYYLWVWKCQACSLHVRLFSFCASIIVPVRGGAYEHVATLPTQHTSGLEWSLQQSASSLLKESLETVAKENKELQAHVGQLMAELDAKVLTRAAGESAVCWGGGQHGRANPFPVPFF